jgi:hypothetical protein
MLRCKRIFRLTSGECRYKEDQKPLPEVLLLFEYDEDAVNEIVVYAVLC